MNCKSSLKQNRNYSMLEPTSRRYREFHNLISNSRTFKYDDNENIRRNLFKNQPFAICSIPMTSIVFIKQFYVLCHNTQSKFSYTC